MKLNKLVAILESIAPLNLAGTWDNVGLLVEPTAHNVKRLLLTNDLSKRVLNEAINTKSDMILSYHPPIFSPMKRLTQASWKEKLIIRCLENNIAIFSPHTSWDAMDGGVNDWLIEPFEYLMKSCEAVEKVEGLDYTDISPKIGYGRRAVLSNSISLKDAVEIIKKHLDLKKVRLAYEEDKKTDEIKIKSVGACAGSGASVLRKARTDLMISGEMSHHEVLNYVENGSAVILCEHSNTERGFLKRMKTILNEKLDEDIDIIISSTDSDPLRIV